MEILVTAMAEQQGETYEQLPIHTMIDARCPPISIWLALRLYPQDVRKRDQMGRLPLHHAAANSIEDDTCVNVVFYCGQQLSQANCKVLQIVLDQFPDAARNVDKDGTLPLAVLLKECPVVSLDCVRILLHSEPRVLATRDISTRMLPFVLAAATKTANGVSLDVVYTLLREDPAAIVIGIVESHHEKYLKAKFSAAEHEKCLLAKELEALRDDNSKLSEDISKLAATALDQENEIKRLKNELQCRSVSKTTTRDDSSKVFKKARLV
jgi:hypothetical protein